jgi:O-antigen/teichoic acid export membrane protein
VRPFALTRAAISQVRAASAQHAVLVKNSGALAIGTGFTAAFGFVYWWLAARYFPPEAIGRASALLSLMGFVGLLGDAGLGTLLAGEIIRRPGQEGGLISAAALTVLTLSLAAGGVGLVISDLTFDAFGRGAGSRGLAGLWFLAGCGLTGLCYIMDQAFLGMLRTAIRMWRQLLFSVCKLGLIAAVAVWSAGGSAILVTWVAGLMISLIFVELIMRRGGSSLIQRPDFQLLHALRRKAADHYLLDLASQTPSIILPYLVTVILSPASNAAFYALWMVFTVAAVGPAAVATVLYPVVRAEPAQYRNRMLLSMSVSLVFAVAFGFFVFAYSEHILRVFNPVFAQIAGDHLRFLGFGMVGTVVKFQICTAARLTNSMRRTSAWFWVGGIFEIGGAVAGCEAYGFEGLTAGWVAAIVIEAAVMAVLALQAGQLTLAQHALDRT